MSDAVAAGVGAEVPGIHAADRSTQTTTRLLAIRLPTQMQRRLLFCFGAPRSQGGRIPPTASYDETHVGITSRDL